MIIGTGCDLANIERIEHSLNKFASRFLKKIFSENELAELYKRENASPKAFACAVAKRFAAKEACSKALGTGISRGTSWKEIEVFNLPSGRPVLKLSGKTLANLKLLGGGKDCNLWVSLSDDFPWAQAFVIIEVQV